MWCFFLVRPRFWDRVLSVCIQLRAQKISLSGCGGSGVCGAVLGLDFEPLYSVTCSKDVVKCGVLWWSGTGFGIGF